MAISEKICWDILNTIKGCNATFNSGHLNSFTVLNATPLSNLEKELVLRYTRSDIEDSIYFLEKRGYLIKHGYLNLTLVAYELSPLAIEALEKKTFTDEEQQAFKEALFDLKQAGWMGMKFNVGELVRRFNKSNKKKDG